MRRRWVRVLPWVAPVAVSALVLVQAVWQPLVLQPGGSLERGLWVRVPGAIRVGDVVVLDTPAVGAAVLSSHGLPPRRRLVKEVAAVGPTSVGGGGRCVIDGRDLGPWDQVARTGRPVPGLAAGTDRRVIGAGSLWLTCRVGRDAGRPGAGVDSRVFGAVPASAVRGPYRLLWSWE